MLGGLQDHSRRDGEEKNCLFFTLINTKSYCQHGLVDVSMFDSQGQTGDLVPQVYS